MMCAKMYLLVLSLFSLVTKSYGDVKQMSTVNNETAIICSAEGLPYTNVGVVKLADEQQIPTRKLFVANDKFVAKINQTCDTMGTYKCVFTLKDGTTRYSPININVDNCSPVLCPGEVTDNIINATADRYLISLCVIAYPDVSDILKVNNKKVYRNTDSNFDWNIKESRFYSSYNITIIIKNMIHLTSGDLTIEICTTQDRCLQLNYTVRTNMVTRSNQGSKNQTYLKVTTLRLKCDAPSMNIPIILSSLAVIMAVVCIICFIIGIVLCRTKDRHQKPLKEHEYI